MIAFHMCFINELVIVKHKYDITPEQLGKSGYISLFFIFNNTPYCYCLKKCLEGHGKVIKFYLQISVWTMWYTLEIANTGH